MRWKSDLQCGRVCFEGVSENLPDLSRFEKNGEILSSGGMYIPHANPPLHARKSQMDILHLPSRKYACLIIREKEMTGVLSTEQEDLDSFYEVAENSEIPWPYLKK